MPTIVADTQHDAWADRKSTASRRKTFFWPVDREGPLLPVGWLASDPRFGQQSIAELSARPPKGMNMPRATANTPDRMLSTSVIARTTADPFGPHGGRCGLAIGMVAVDMMQV